MCGLVALFSTKNNGFSSDEGRMLEESMIFNQLRGDDSTGAVCITNKDNWAYVKSLGGYKSFTRHTGFTDFRKMFMNDGRLVFAHGRAATRGQVTIDNAHPFHIKHGDGEIVFIHNGTLDYDQSLKGMWDYRVDSEYLGAMIAKHGAEKALSEVNGAIACMWWDVNDNTFNFFHNKDRPLCFMRTKTGEFFLNSELWVLKYLNWKNNLGVPDKEIYMIDEMSWHKTKVNGDGAAKYHITKIKKARNVVKYIPRQEYAYGRRVAEYYDDDDIAHWNDTYNHNRNVIPLILPPEEKEFWDRKIESIEWLRMGDKWQKVISYRDRHVHRENVDGPPEPDLLRMYELKQSGDVMKVYEGREGNRSLIYVTSKYDHFVEDKRKKLAEEKAERTPERTKENEKGVTTIRFNTRHPATKDKVKHYGEILSGADKPHLQVYENSVDGKTSIGREVIVEMLYCDEKDVKSSPNGKMVRVVCSELKPKQDTYIDYVFYSHMTKAEVERIKIFRGVVGGITLSTIEEQKESGAIVICSLYNVGEADLRQDNDNDEKVIETAAATVH